MKLRVLAALNPHVGMMLGILDTELSMAERQAAYRIRLSAEFDLTAAASQADYLSALGISHVRCSPSPLAAESVTDDELGDLENGDRRSQERLRFSAALGRYCLEQLPEGPITGRTEATFPSPSNHPGSDKGRGSHDIVGNNLLPVAAGLFFWQQSELSRVRESFTNDSELYSPADRCRMGRWPIVLQRGVESDQFHESCARIQSESPEVLLDWPLMDLGEDALARILVLSEVPEVWRAAISGWSVRLSGYRKNGFPDRTLEYCFYQTAVGSWPLDELDLVPFLTKIARESGVYASGTQPVENYERALREFIEQALGDEVFMTEVREFVGSITMAGRLNSMALTLIKLTAPGVPQIHQGTELWDLSLAGAGNHPRVDYMRRRKLLQEIASCDAQACLMRMAEGMPKLWILHRTLLLRKFRPEPFCAQSSYTPVRASGTYAQYLVSYLRSSDIMVIAPRWTVRRGLDWRDTTIEVPQGGWVNCLTDESVSGGLRSIADLTRNFPVVLLERTD